MSENKNMNSDDSAYITIAEKFDKHAGGAPKGKSSHGFSEAFIDYLKLIYPPESAELVQHLHVTRGFYSSSFNADDWRSAGQLARVSGKTIEEVRTLLDPIVDKAALVSTSKLKGRLKNAMQAESKHDDPALDNIKNLFKLLKVSLADAFMKGSATEGGIPVLYALPVYPTLLNIHQLYPEIKKDDIEAAKLYQEFFIKDEYYRHYESSDMGTQTWRTIPVKRALKPQEKILDSEEAHAIIDASVTDPVLSPCPCRTRTEKLGIRECSDQYPVASCISLEAASIYMESVGYGKKVTKEEAKQYFDEMQDLGMIGTTENFSNMQHTIICLCCGCCCSMVRGRTRWENPVAVNPSNFVPQQGEACVYCGKCVERCHLEAITVDKKQKTYSVDETLCIGCGVCTLTCPKDSLKLHRIERSIPTADRRDMYNTIAVENGKDPR